MAKLSLQVNMEWILKAPQIHSTFGSLGYLDGDSYHTNDDCESLLEEILNKLLAEDRTLRTFRRAVAFGENIQKDLVPILIHVKDKPKIIDLTIKILVNLTIPVECLLSVDALSKNNVGRHAIYELNNLLTSCKEAFTDSRATKAVLDVMKLILDNDTKITQIQLDDVNNCLLLLRNILHVPESLKARSSNNQTTLQNKILWNLFTQSIDKILLYLVTSNHGDHWSVTVVQIIALVYKDQHVGTLQKLLNIWFESSLSDTSEDNESNTSPPEQGSKNSSPDQTSDPTSDSSDNGINRETLSDPTKTPTTKVEGENQPNPETQNNPEITQPSEPVEMIQEAYKPPAQTKLKNEKYDASSVIKSQSSGSKKECTSTNSEHSDCGYVTQMENQESISTSSNDDDDQRKKPIHQKPPNSKQRHNNTKNRPAVPIQEKKDKRRKKLVKRGKTNIINMKGLVHHTATDEDITNVLKEFTVDFLLKGYGQLVQFLHSKLVFDIKIQMDTSHFFWLITYFLKFAAQLELDLEHVDHVLSFPIISYLTYEGVHLCEQIQLLSKTQSPELKPSLRRMHLVVTAIREFIQTLETYQKISHLSKEDRAQINKLQIRICATQELRSLLLLLIRHYQSSIQSRQYLQDLIVTNHILLLFLDNGAKLDECASTNMIDHLRQFASVEVMHQYGLLLEDFRSNGEYVNDCIFTMMHHIAGDLKSITTLFQPHILKVFSLMWETDFEVCDDWSDLVDYVINQFIKTPRPPVPLPIMVSENLIPEPATADDEPMQVDSESWSQEDKDKLHWYYMQCAKNPNVIDSIASLYKEDGIEKSNHAIIHQLRMQEIISEEKYKKFNSSGTEDILDPKNSGNFIMSNEIHGKDEVERLKSELQVQHMEKALVWLQNILLETCYAKMCLNNKNPDEIIAIHDNIEHIIEPTPFHNILVKQSIPVVPWNNEQSTAIHNQTFLHLLHRLGFHLPADTGKLFVRIPSFWTEEVLLHMAFRLGPINPDSVKFSLSDIPQSLPMETDEHLLSQTSFREEEIITQVKPSITIANESVFRIHRIKQVSSSVQYTPLPSLSLPMSEMMPSNKESSTWLDMIMKNKPSCNRDDRIPYGKMKDDDADSGSIMGPPHDRLSFDNIPTSEDNSICETASVTSDLTRMYVSDEEEKHDIMF